MQRSTGYYANSDAALPPGHTEPWTDFPIAQAAREVPGAHISPALLKPASGAVQAVKDHWKRKQGSIIIDRISSLADARAAVAEVSAQGEGFGASPDGHFDRFVKAWQTAAAAAPASIATDVAVDPWYIETGAPPATPRTGDQLTNPAAVAFARLSDRCYEIVVLSAALDLLLAPTTPAIERQLVAGASIQCMKECLSPTIAVLAELPITSPDGPGVKRCGAPYLQQPLQIATNPRAVLDRIRAAKDEAVACATAIVADATAPISHQDKAQSIATTLEDDVWGNALGTLSL